MHLDLIANPFNALSTSSKHHFIGRGHSLANEINTTKKEIERSKKYSYSQPYS